MLCEGVAQIVGDAALLVYGQWRMAVPGEDLLKIKVSPLLQQIWVSFV